jgi:hypothetical protein
MCEAMYYLTVSGQIELGMRATARSEAASEELKTEMRVIKWICVVLFLLVLLK